MASGGGAVGADARLLQEGVHAVIGTPGRVLDLIRRKLFGIYILCAYMYMCVRAHRCLVCLYFMNVLPLGTFPGRAQ